MISCGLHNPPGWSPRSSWQANEITVSEGEAHECLISRHVPCRPTATGHVDEETILQLFWFVWVCLFALFFRGVGRLLIEF